MKNLYVIFLLITCYGFSQCNTSPITLGSQAEVDAFGVNYPNCTAFGNLNISGGDITDLTPLSQIVSVSGLVITNTGLNSLAGLESLSVLSGQIFMEISNNSNLTSISALSNVTDSAGLDTIQISDNPLLQSLEGLEWVINPLDLFIFNNDSLLNLMGLSATETLETLIVRGNSSLQDFTGLNSNTILNSALIIDDNDNLEHLAGLEDTVIGYSLEILNNDNLMSLAGLGAINETFNYLVLDNNLNLSDISQINLTSINIIDFFEMDIVDNPILSNCNTDFICNFLAENYNPNEDYLYITIENNGEACSALNDVLFNCGTVPFNDDCENAFPIALGESILAYNLNSANSANVPSCNNEGEILDVWFTFNVESNEVALQIDEGFSFQLWEGDCANLTQVPNTCGTDLIPDVEINSNTDYYVQVWSVNAEGGRSAPGQFNFTLGYPTLSVHEEVFKGFSIAPNPVSTYLTLTATQPLNTVSVYNTLGQKVMAITPQESQSKLDFNTLENGLYFITVTIGNLMRTFKIIKK